MRIPATHFAGNLMWTRSGVVFATWSLSPLPAGKTDDDLRFIADAHTALYRSLVGKESLLRGQMVWTDPVAVVAKMIDGVDLYAHQSWAEECEATIDHLSGYPLGERRWSLTVPLSGGDWKQRITTITRSATTDLCDQLHLPAVAPSDTEIERFRLAAEEFRANLPPTFNPTPVTVAQQIWSLRQAQTRGAELVTDPYDTPGLGDDLWDLRGRAAAGEPLLDPAGLTDTDANRAKALTAPMRRRWLKVVSDTGTTSYQAGLVLADPPAGGMASPGGEFLGRVDQVGVPVDVAVRLVVRSRAEGLRRNKRGFTLLTDQVDQVEASDTFASLSASLQEAARLLVEYNQRLSLDPREVEVEPVVMLSVTGPDGESVDDLCREFQQHPANKDFSWARPVGAEDAIFWAMQPGGRLTSQLRDYRHIMPAADFGCAAPLMTYQLGAANGPVLGLNRTSPLLSLVHVDLIGESERNFSPSIAFAGELGAGKSFAEKAITGHEIDRGARGFALDGSRTREWAVFAGSLSCTTAVADVEAPKVSLDPLRVLPLHRAGPVLQSFLTKLCDFSATSVEGRTLAKALKASYLEAHHIKSCQQLLAHLARDAELPQARDIADRIGVFADPDMAGSLADIVFGDDLPPLDLSARMVVVGTHGIQLPSTAELSTPHRYQRLDVAKLFGQAFFLLATSYAYEVCFGDPADPALFVVDETWRVTQSEEGAAKLLEFVRDGRKVKAGVVLGSHDPAGGAVDGAGDFGSATIAGLIGYKVVLRHRSPELARNCVRWLGFDPAERPDLVEHIQKMSPQNEAGVVAPERRGEGVMVDARNRFGYITVLPPARAARASALDSTPPPGKAAVR